MNVNPVKKSLKTASDETAFINSILLNSEPAGQNKSYMSLKRGISKISASQMGKENRFFNIYNKNASLYEMGKGENYGPGFRADGNW